MRSRWLGSMLAWTLNTKPETLGSVGSIGRGSAGCGRGGGAQAASASRSSLHAEIVVGRAEEHRRQMAGAIALEIEGGIARAHQLDILGELGIGDRVVLDHLADAAPVGGVEHQHAVVVRDRRCP